MNIMNENIEYNDIDKIRILSHNANQLIYIQIEQNLYKLDTKLFNNTHFFFRFEKDLLDNA